MSGIENNTKEKVDDKKVSKKRTSKYDKLKEKMEELDHQLAESKDKYLRLYAEFDNFKKRSIRERMELINTAGRETISSLLPVLDDFDRAKRSADDKNTNESFSEGVSLVYNKLYSILISKGLESMESTGEVFDSELHDAITEIPAPSNDLKGKIIDTVEKGYKLNSKIIRHAKVVVGK